MLLELLPSLRTYQSFVMTELWGGQVSLLSSDLALKGIQVRQAELIINENFGKLSTSPLRVGKTRLVFGTATG